MTIHLPFKMEFLLYLTGNCNLRCEMCCQYGEGYKEYAKDEMTLNEWDSFLQTIADVEPKPVLILIGGEPLLYKNFEKLFKLIQEYEFPVHIITNGTLLDKYLPLLCEYNTKITISIDGLGETHDKIRNKKGTFKKVIENIKRIEKYQKEGSKVQLLTNFVVLPDNIDEIIPFYKEMSNYNISNLTFQHLQFSTPDLDNLSSKEWMSRLNKAYECDVSPQKEYKIDQAYFEKIKNTFDEFRKCSQAKNCFEFPALKTEELFKYYLSDDVGSIRPNRICTTAWTSPFIQPNGDVSNCINNTIGNIKNENFWDIWNNEKANMLRETLKNEGKFSICAKCCNFYKSNFVNAPNCELAINDQIYNLPNELNFVLPAYEIALIHDKFQDSKNSKNISVLPVPLHSQYDLVKLAEKEEILSII